MHLKSGSETDNGKKVAVRRAYQRPTLTCFGDVRDVTLGVAGSFKDDNNETSKLTP